MALPRGMKKLMGSSWQLEKELGGIFLREEFVCFLNTDQIYSAPQKNNCTCAEGNNILQHKGKKEP